MSFELKGIYKEGCSAPVYLKLEKEETGNITLKCIDGNGNPITHGNILDIEINSCGKYTIFTRYDVNPDLPFETDEHGQVVVRT